MSPWHKATQVSRQKPKPAPPAAKVVSDILQTEGKYALIAAYADANGLTYQRALQLYHREKAATK
jgi:hypothetical protein